MLDIQWVGGDLILWVDYYCIGEFAEMVYEAIDCVNFQRNCIALNIIPICEYFDIDPHNICKKEE